MKVRLHLVEESPGALALGRQEAAPVLEAVMGAARDGAQDVEIGEEGLGGRGVRSHGGACPVVGDAQHEQRIGQDQLARGGHAGDVGLIESADLSGGQSMGRNRLDEADAVCRIGARHRYEVLHGGVRDQPAGLHVLLDGVGQRAHQTQAPGHPAHAAIKAPRQRVERQAMLLMQRAQQPALLERAGRRVGVQQLPKDQRLGLRHLPDHGGHGVALQALETPDPLVAVHDDVGGAGRHDHDGDLLPGVGQRRQQPAFPRRLAHAQPLIPHVDLMKFQFHGRSSAGAYSRTGPIASCPEDREVGRQVQSPQRFDGRTGLAWLTGEVGRFLLGNQAFGPPSGLVRPPARLDRDG